jgi:hypothetical protein
MANQLLATLYVQSPEFLYGNVTVTAKVQYQSGNNWYENTSELSTTVTNAHYTDSDGQQRYRYKVDVFRTESSQYDPNTGQYVYYYPLHKAGTYKRRLLVTVNNSFTLERMIYLTIQPNLHVYRERIQESGERSQEDLVTTTETVTSQNPLQKQVTVNVLSTPEALSAREVKLTESNDYKGTVFVKSNLPVDTYCDDLSIESNDTNSYDYDVWLRLNNQIRVTRKIGTNEYKWNDNYGSYPIVKTDTQGKYVSSISDNSDNYYETQLLNYPYYGAAALGLEKPFLDMPLVVESNLRLYGRGVSRYTGIGETVETTAPVILPLQAVLKTVHAVKLMPSVVTLDEDNNYTSFVTVEANDGADWTFAPVDNRITVTPSSGTGRAAVVIKKGVAFNPSTHFVNVPLTVTSTVNAATYPDIEGNYIVSDTAAVHIEQYVPAHNSLIPKMGSDTMSGVTIRHIPNDTANELNMDFNNAAFAITSVDDILIIDTGEAVVLDTIEIKGQNIRRLIAANTYKGGAAIAFSLYGTNEPEGVWTLLRNGSAVTDVPANTGTTSTIGAWTYGSTTTVSIKNNYVVPICPQCGAPLIFCPICGQFACSTFDFEQYYNNGTTCDYGHDVWGYHYYDYYNYYDTPPTFIPPAQWTTAYRYYKLVPVCQSSSDVEMSCTLSALNIYKKIVATPVTIPTAGISDNNGTSSYDL